LQVIAAARVAGAEAIVAVDVGSEKLERAHSVGATHTVDASAGDVVAAVRERTRGGADHAFEVVGRPDTIRIAWDVIRAGGQAIVVGLVPRGIDVSVPGIEFLSDKTLRGTYYGSGDAARDLPELAALALAGDLDLGSVVTHTTDLDGVEAAFERLRRGEGARTVVIIDPELAGGAP
jgi:S-(hydroxymethyl)glutathione dehydrogenase / alcohol dehydrogenase